MANNSGVQIKVNIDKSSINNKVYAVTHNQGILIDIANTYSKIVEPWTPYDTGYLKDEVYITSSSSSSGVQIVYEAPYASKVYYGDDINFHKDKHPLATAHWDKVAMQTEREHFISEAQRIVKERAKQVRG